MIETTLFVVGAYLLGAIPFGLWIGWGHGVDVRAEGSKNIGATNVGRVVGRRWGYVCLLLDVLKGLLPTLAASFFLIRRPITDMEMLRWLLVAVAPVVGHVFPIYLGFRGGKGVSTTVGVALGIYPYFTIPMVAALIGYGFARFTTGLVSLGSIAIALIFPFACYFYARWSGLTLSETWPLQAVAVLLGLLIIVRHRSNIARLLRGQESGLRDAPAR